MDRKINVSVMSRDSLKSHVASALEIILRNHDDNVFRAKNAGWTLIDPDDKKETDETLRAWLVKSLPECYRIN